MEAAIGKFHGEALMELIIDNSFQRMDIMYCRGVTRGIDNDAKREKKHVRG